MVIIARSWSLLQRASPNINPDKKEFESCGIKRVKKNIRRTQKDQNNMNWEPDPATSGWGQWSANKVLQICRQDNSKVGSGVASHTEYLQNCKSGLRGIVEGITKRPNGEGGRGTRVDEI